MAACLRSIRIGIPCLMKGKARHSRGNSVCVYCCCCRNGLETSASFHHTNITTASLHHYQHHIEGDGRAGKHTTITTTTTTTATATTTTTNKLHSFDPLGFTPIKAHTVDDIEIQCSTYNHNNHNHNNNIRTFRLPPNSLWYPRNSKRHNGNVICSLSYSPLEEEVISVTTTQTQPLNAVNNNTNNNNNNNNNSVFDMGVFIKCMGIKGKEMQNCDSLSSSEQQTSGGMEGKGGRPSAEQLSKIFNSLADTLPKLFTQPLDYTIYAQDVVFENRIRGVRTVGLFPYVRQVALLRTVGHLRFAYVKFEVLKITKHPEEGSVKVRWRINGLSGTKAILQFWKVKIWDWKSVEGQMVNWYDGFSTFYIGQDGLVHTHIADSMMPDEEHKLTEKESITSKIASLLGLVNRPTSSGSLNTTTTTATATATTATTTTAAATEILEQDLNWCRELMLPLERLH